MSAAMQEAWQEKQQAEEMRKEARGAEAKEVRPWWTSRSERP